MTTRISGLASGLDIDSMVTELMSAEKTKLNNMIKKRTWVEWQQEDYRTMAAKIVDFRNNKLSSYNLSSAINAKTTEVSGDTSAVKVTSTSSTATGSLNIKVNSLATATTKIYNFSGGTTETVDGNTTEKTLADLGFDDDGDGSVTITINDNDITLDSTATLKDLASAINSDTSTHKATAVYNSNGTFSITSTQTGKDTLTVENFSSDADDSSSTNGENAVITVNGVEYSQASNKFSVNGYGFTILAESDSGSTTTLTATQDTDKIVETIKSFVSDYNTLISAINSELSESRDYDYEPLSDDEKDEMEEDEIELWEGKARAGTLHSDSTLTKMISELRTATTSLIAGIKDENGNSISIGITTGSYSEKGKLVLDEDQLRTALDSNPDAVINLFSAKSTDTSPGSKTSGVFAKMQDSTMDALKELQTKAGTSTTSTELTTTFLESSLLSEQIRDMEDREEREQDRLDDLEDYYYKMFTNMETAINSFNTQSSALSSLTSS